MVGLSAAPRIEIGFDLAGCCSELMCKSSVDGTEEGNGNGVQ